jgi:hypothetical protein
MKGKLRWKLGEKEQGLAAVGACHRGYILHDGEEEFARIYPNGGGWKSAQKGWYWTASVGELSVNTFASPVADIDQAKRNARAYVDKALKEQPQ